MSTFDYTQEERQRDISAGTYKKFYIETPIEDGTFIVAAEDTNAILVSLQIEDPSGDAWPEMLVVDIYCTSDAAGETVAAPSNIDLTVETGDAGMVVYDDIASTGSASVRTNDAGLVQMTFTNDEDEAVTDFYVTAILPNGKYVVSGVLDFADDTP